MTDCSICNGMGWLRQDLPTHHPDFGSLVRCECNPAQGEPEEEKEPRVEQWASRADIDGWEQEPIPF